MSRMYKLTRLSMVGVVGFVLAQSAAACDSAPPKSGKRIACGNLAPGLVDCPCYWITDNSSEGLDGSCTPSAESVSCAACGTCYENRFQCNASPNGDSCRCTFGPDALVPPGWQPVSACASTSAHPNCYVWDGMCSCEATPSSDPQVIATSECTAATPNITRCHEADEVSSCKDSALYQKQYDKPPGKLSNLLCDFASTSAASTSVASSSAGSGGGTKCPSDGVMTCSSDVECCSGTCAKTTTSGTSKHCTLPCTQDSDCDGSSVWKPNPNPGFLCNFQTGYCY